MTTQRSSDAERELIEHLSMLAQTKRIDPDTFLEALTRAHLSLLTAVDEIRTEAAELKTQLVQSNEQIISQLTESYAAVQKQTLQNAQLIEMLAAQMDPDNLLKSITKHILSNYMLTIVWSFLVIFIIGLTITPYVWFTQVRETYFIPTESLIQTYRGAVGLFLILLLIGSITSVILSKKK